MIRIAFATETPAGLDGEVARHFGRCPYYTFVDVEEDGKVKDYLVVPNPAAEGHGPGEIPRFIAEQGAAIVVSGGMGPKAQEWFLQLGIKPYVGLEGRVRDILPAILSGKVEPLESPGEGCGEGDKDCHHQD